MKAKTIVILPALVITCIAFLSGCFPSEKEKNIFYEMSYQQITEESQSRQKGFCLILTDSNFDCNKYQKKIISTELKDKVLWNFVNTDKESNHWYKYLLGSEKTPFTMVFNDKGKLINIVFGVSSFSYCSIASAISTCSPEEIRYKNFGFAENSVLATDNLDINTFLNDLIQIHQDQSNAASLKCEKIKESIKEQEYPYNLFLQIQHSLSFMPKDSVNHLAERLIRKYTNAYYSPTFKPLLTTTKIILNQDKNEPLHLKVQIPDNHTFCIGDNIQITVKASNLTQDSLRLIRIEPSCNCITMKDAPWRVLPPSSTTEYNFQMKAEETGELYREIYFETDTDIPLTVADFKLFINP